MKLSELENNLKSEVKPVYLIKGEDFFLRQKAINLIKKYANLQLEDFNLSVFDEDNFAAQAIFNSMNQMPFGSGKKVVICHATKINADFKSQFDDYVTKPNASAVLVIVEKTAKACLSIEKQCDIIDFSNMFESEIRAEINEYIKEKSIEIEPNALNDLLNRTNFSLSKSIVELEKLQAYCGGIIDYKSVGALVPKTLEYNVFEFTNALASKNKNYALELLNEMLASGNDNIISLVSTNFRRIFFSSISNLTSAELAKIFNVKEYAITKAKENAKNFSPKKLKDILDTLLEVEYWSKSGGMTAENSAYYLTFKILEA